MAALRTIRIETWREFRDLVDGEELRSWAFRGQPDASLPLETSLARHLKMSEVHPEAWQSQERRILRIFQRKAHVFLQHVPSAEAAFEWLALMEHHGAPTRLLDFTWSPYVAAFFALERATSDAAVWALFPPAVQDRAADVMTANGITDRDAMRLRDVDSYEAVYLPGIHPIVFVGEPYTMNKRLIAQEGTFAVPGVIDRPVEAILGDTKAPADCIVKIVLHTRALRSDAMRSLYTMNITQASLFPDLEGLARSMAYELEFHWAFDPSTMARTPGFE